MAKLTDSIAITIRSAADVAGIPHAIALAVAKIESGFNPSAVSPVGARGLFQIMPKVWAELTPHDPGGALAFDAAENARAGTRLLARLYGQFGDWPTAFAAYVWGPGNVRGQLAAGKPWPGKVAAYIDRVKRAAIEFDPLAFGGEPPPPFPPPPPGAPVGPGWRWVWAFCPGSPTS